MKENWKSYIAFLLALAFLAGLKISLQWQTYALPSTFRVGCVDRTSLVDEGHLSQAIALVAKKEGISLVVDKRLLVVGGINLTSEVNQVLHSPEDLSQIEANGRQGSEFPLFPIGVVNQEKLFSLPQIKEARSGYFKLLRNLKAEIQRSHFSPQEKANLEKRYSALLENYQANKINPLLDRLNQAILQVAKTKGLWLVLNRKGVFYGGIDITPLVEQAWNDPSLINRNDIKTPVLPHAQVAFLDEAKVLPKLPLFSHLQELDREIAMWQAGDYGIAETLLSPHDALIWEKARQQALAEWRSALKEASLVYRWQAQLVKGLPAGKQQAVSEATTFLTQTANKLLKQKAENLEQDYQKIVKEADVSFQKNLQTYGSKLLQERNQALSQYQALLLQKAEVQLQARAALLQLASQKNKTQTEKAKQELLAYRNTLLKQIQGKLRLAALSLDKTVRKKMMLYRKHLLESSLLGLKEKQKNLKNAMAVFRSKAFQEAEAKTAKRYGKSIAFISARLVAAESNASMQEKLAQEESRLEKGLSQLEKKILAHSPKYQAVLRNIQRGDHKAAFLVIQSLQEEKANTLKQMRSELSSLVEPLAKKQGIVAIFGEISANGYAPDLTPRLMKKF